MLIVINFLGNKQNKEQFDGCKELRCVLIMTKPATKAVDRVAAGLMELEI